MVEEAFDGAAAWRVAWAKHLQFELRFELMRKHIDPLLGKISAAADAMGNSSSARRRAYPPTTTQCVRAPRCRLLPLS